MNTTQQYQRRAQVVRWREDGWTFAEIGKRLGVSTSRAHRLYVEGTWPTERERAARAFIQSRFGVRV